MKKRIKLFSHNDLDGYCCNILSETMLEYSELSCENLNYNDINERIEEFFENGEVIDYDNVYITDISVNERVAEIIDKYERIPKLEVKLLDHHKTALWLNKYDWANVIVEYDGDKTCGAELMLSMIAIDSGKDYSSFIEKNRNIVNFVEEVRRYDTWEWLDIYNDTKAKELNDLFYILGNERFNELVVSVLSSGYLNVVEIMLHEHRLLLDLQQKQIDKYIEEKNRSIIESNIQGYNIGFVFAERFISELGNRLSELNPKFDLIGIIGDNKISYRTIKDNIDCGAFAKIFGGGGHIKASGSPINEDSKIEYLKVLFDL